MTVCGDYTSVCLIDYYASQKLPITIGMWLNNTAFQMP